MPKHRTYSIEFKHQVVQEYLGGETLHGLLKRHHVSRNLIRVWIAKYEAGEFDGEAGAADLLQQYEARIPAVPLARVEQPKSLPTASSIRRGPSALRERWTAINCAVAKS